MTSAVQAAGHGIGRGHGVHQLSAFRFGKESARAEVQNADFVIRSDQKIRRFEQAVDQALVMTDSQCFRRLERERCGHPRQQPTFPLH